MFSNDEFMCVIRHIFTNIKFLLPYNLSKVVIDQSIAYSRLIADEGIRPLSTYKMQSRESYVLLFSPRVNRAKDLKDLYHEYLHNVREKNSGIYNGYYIPISGISNSYTSINNIYAYSKDSVERNNIEKRRKALNYKERKIRRFMNLQIKKI